MLAFLLDRRENGEGLASLAAGLALPHAGEKKGSSIVEKKNNSSAKVCMLCILHSHLSWDFSIS